VLNIEIESAYRSKYRI